MAVTIKHRHQSALPDTGADISTPEWNDSLVVAAGTDGQFLQVDAGSPDGVRSFSALQKGTYAARPAADGKNSVYAQTDGWAWSRDNGASYDNFGPMFPFTTPTLPGTNLNLGSSTIVSSKDALVFTGAATGAANNLVLAVKTYAAPYVMTMFVLPVLIGRTSSGGHNGYGLAIRDSATGRIHFHGIFQSTSGQVIARTTKYTTFSALSADYQSPTIGRCPNWMRLIDDNINIVSQVSEDGQNWLTLHTIARTNFVATPDQIGLCMSTENTTTPNFAPIMTVTHLS